MLLRRSCLQQARRSALGSQPIRAICVKDIPIWFENIFVSVGIVCKDRVYSKEEGVGFPANKSNMCEGHTNLIWKYISIHPIHSIRPIQPMHPTPSLCATLRMLRALWVCAHNDLIQLQLLSTIQLHSINLVFYIWNTNMKLQLLSILSPACAHAPCTVGLRA